MKGGRRLRFGILLAVLIFALCSWAGWSVVQTRLTLAQSPAARGAVAGCNDVEGSTWIYRVTLVGRGAVCSALMRQGTYYSYATGHIVPTHWSRLDCAVAAPQAAAYCSEHMLATLGDWVGLAGPPAPEVAALTATGAR
jgi:hypothetical protein